MKKWVTVAAHPTTPRPSLPGAGGLAVANQLYNKLKWDGKELGQGDIAIVDVSLVNPCTASIQYRHTYTLTSQPTGIRIYRTGSKTPPLSTRVDAGRSRVIRQARLFPTH